MGMEPQQQLFDVFDAEKHTKVSAKFPNLAREVCDGDSMMVVPAFNTL